MGSTRDISSFFLRSWRFWSHIEVKLQLFSANLLLTGFFLLWKLRTHGTSYDYSVISPLNGLNFSQRSRLHWILWSFDAVGQVGQQCLHVWMFTMPQNLGQRRFLSFLLLSCLVFFLVLAPSTSLYFSLHLLVVEMCVVNSHNIIHVWSCCIRNFISVL